MNDSAHNGIVAVHEGFSCHKRIAGLGVLLGAKHRVQRIGLQQDNCPHYAQNVVVAEMGDLCLLLLLIVSPFWLVC